MHNSSSKFHIFIYLDVRSRNVWFYCSPETKTMTYFNLPGFNAPAGNWNHEIWSASFGVGTSIQTRSTLSMLTTPKIYHIVYSFPNEWLEKAAPGSSCSDDDFFALSLSHLRAPASFLDLYAYAGYKFVALCINMLVSLYLLYLASKTCSFTTIGGLLDLEHPSVTQQPNRSCNNCCFLGWCTFYHRSE